jgi:alcohol dehydrogenase class IV
MTYEFLGPRRIVTGEGSITSVVTEVRSLRGTNPLIVTDGGIAKTDLLKRLTSVLDQEKMPYAVFSDVEPDPGIAVVEKGGKVCVQGDHDLLIAFGGGSSIDAAKVISILVRNKGSVKDFVGVPEFGNDPVPVIAIPTTAGTGSEVTLWPS